MPYEYLIMYSHFGKPVDEYQQQLLSSVVVNYDHPITPHDIVELGIKLQREGDAGASVLSITEFYRSGNSEQ